MQRFSTLTTALRARPAAAPSSLRFYSASPSSSPSTASPVASTSSATPEAPVAAQDGQAAEPELAYYVPRSRFGELPVYSDIRNAGTKVLTIIRKAEGDVEALRRDLSSFLTPAAQTYIKPQGRQIVVKGDWVRETKEWLAAKGF
ncbi:hypothetical protein JCM10213_000927 [Rhodosporidiobolus nylandii]